MAARVFWSPTSTTLLTSSFLTALTYAKINLCQYDSIYHYLGSYTKQFALLVSFCLDQFCGHSLCLVWSTIMNLCYHCTVFPLVLHALQYLSYSLSCLLCPLLLVITMSIPLRIASLTCTHTLENRLPLLVDMDRCQVSTVSIQVQDPQGYKHRSPAETMKRPILIPYIIQRTYLYYCYSTIICLRRTFQLSSRQSSPLTSSCYETTSMILSHIKPRWIHLLGQETVQIFSVDSLWDRSVWPLLNAHSTSIEAAM